MRHPFLDLAETVIRSVDRENPADAVLRRELRSAAGVSRDDGALASRAVFSYFRWFGWLNPAMPLSERLHRAMDLAESFGSDPSRFTDADLVVKSVPDWIGTEIEVTPAWVRALQTPPPLWLRAKRGDGKALARDLEDCRSLPSNDMPEAIEYRGERDLFRTDDFQTGRFEVQDLSSQAVGLICAPVPGQTWWDACAGEGGKTLHLSDLMGNKGLIWASDRAEWRLKTLKRRTARAGAFNYRAAIWNGGPKLPTKTKFDGVLVDAPCGGIGTWGRNPHARWTTTPQDIQELSEIQINLLANAAVSVKPGGKLVYSVCTLTRSETVEVAGAFDARFPEFKRVPITPPFSPGTTPSLGLTIWPQDSRGNGMFIASWVRSAAA